MMWTLLGVVGCVSVEPSGQPFRPVAPTLETSEATEPAEATPAEGETQEPAEVEPTAEVEGGFDFEASDRETPADPAMLPEQALSTVTLPTAGDEVAEVAEPSEPTGPMSTVPVWDPTKPLADASFGVRVVATLLDLQPPRAVLGLPNGEELVVRPGSMLEAEGLVVLAIGRDAVQLAKVTPQGFHASVTTETVRALYPAMPAPE